jgi:hypothetical protein
MCRVGLARQLLTTRVDKDCSTEVSLIRCTHIHGKIKKFK